MFSNRSDIAKYGNEDTRDIIVRMTIYPYRQHFCFNEKRTFACILNIGRKDADKKVPR